MKPFLPFSRALVTWPHKSQFFAHNSPGLHFYPTSCGVIRNQRQKNTSNPIFKYPKYSNMKYKDFWKFLGEWFSICVEKDNKNCFCSAQGFPLRRSVMPDSQLEIVKDKFLTSTAHWSLWRILGLFTYRPLYLSTDVRTCGSDLM